MDAFSGTRGTLASKRRRIARFPPRWHTEARELTPTRSRHEACREAEQFSAWRQARVLRVENQDHFRRAYLRDHPVPHVAALLPRGPRWDAFDAREKRSQAVAWARAPRDGAAVRPSLAAACGALGSRHGGCVEVPPRHRAVWKSNLQPDFNVRVCDRFDARLSAVLREIDESNRFVQKSAESTSI